MIKTFRYKVSYVGFDSFGQKEARYKNITIFANNKSDANMKVLDLGWTLIKFLG